MRHPSFSLRNICILFLLLVVFAALSLICLVIIPTRRATALEVSYFEEISRLSDLDSQWDRPSKYRIIEPTKPPAYNERLLPLIYDITQLSSWGYLKQMRLHPDGTAEYPQQEYWIYIGGTAGKSCVDPAYMCDAYNAAFNRLLEYFHTHRVNTTSNAGLAFIDCDVSPLLCDILGVDPVMIAHVRTHSPCRVTRNPLEWFCTVSWRFIPLPLKTMPWNPTVRLSGRDGAAPVPVFPSAFEQLKAIIGCNGAEMGVHLQDHEMEEVSPDLDREKESNTEAEWSGNGNSGKNRYGPVEKMLWNFGAYTAYTFNRISSLWERRDDI